jgi:uncharacterized membrane protein YeaQ/YmgE (transglycosylase-associated protein family)
MSFGIWIAVGLFIGFLASKLVIKTGDGLLFDVGVDSAALVAMSTPCLNCRRQSNTLGISPRTARRQSGRRRST